MRSPKHSPEESGVMRVGFGALVCLEMAEGGELWLSPYGVEAVYDDGLPREHRTRHSWVQLKDTNDNDEYHLSRFRVVGAPREVLKKMSNELESDDYSFRHRRRRRRLVLRRSAKNVKVRRAKRGAK